MKSILRSLGLGLMAVVLVFLTNCAQSANISEEDGNPRVDMVAANNVNYTEQVQAGVKYFQKQAQEQLPLAEQLLEALKSNNLEAAKKAYVESRPPYEQIRSFSW